MDGDNLDTLGNEVVLHGKAEAPSHLDLGCWELGSPVPHLRGLLHTPGRVLRTQSWGGKQRHRRSSPCQKHAHFSPSPCWVQGEPAPALPVGQGKRLTSFYRWRGGSKEIRNVSKHMNPPVCPHSEVPSLFSALLGLNHHTFILMHPALEVSPSLHLPSE